MRVLVTGAGDYLGQRVLAALAAGLPPDARILGIDPETGAAPPGTERIAVDPLDAAATAAAVAAFAPTGILHLAAFASVSESSRTPALAWRADLLGSLNLAEAVATTCRDARFVFVSSTEVYGAAFAPGEGVGETVAPRPCNIFGRTKTACEAILRDVLASGGVRHAVLRPSNYIGPGQSEIFVASSFAAQIARIEAGRVPPVLEVGDIAVRRDFIDVADVAAACFTAIRADLPDGAAFNVSSGKATPVSAILNTLRGLARVPFEVRVAEDRLRPAELRSESSNADAFTAATGWRPQIALADSLGAILDDARARV